MIIIIVIIIIIIIIMTIRLRRLSFLVDELINFSEDAEASKQILRCIDVIIIIYVYHDYHSFCICAHIIFIYGAESPGCHL